jgi:hypothetical protein
MDRLTFERRQVWIYLTACVQFLHLGPLYVRHAAAFHLVSNQDLQAGQVNGLAPDHSPTACTLFKKINSSLTPVSPHPRPRHP